MADRADIASGRLQPEAYARNFDDLEPPLDRKRALVEASRCYFCYDAPCIDACPTGIDIPSFIRKIATDNLQGSALDILSANIMGGMCARVCPTEVLCEGACVRNGQDQKPVQIGQLQRYATDWLFEENIQPFERAAPTSKQIAVIGAGPAGLACAHGCAQAGHEVVVFELREKPGGLNEYGIAAYKVPHDFAQREVAFVTGIGGITIRTGQMLGRDVHLVDLRRDFDAVFIGTGLAGVQDLGLDGEELGGIESAVDYIARLRQTDDLATLPVGRDVVVIGGGSTAIDIAIQSRRLGAENVTIVYRRGPQQMGATEHEQELAQVNGVKIKHWARPIKLIGYRGRVRAVEFEYTALNDRGRLIRAGGSFALNADMVFKAIGQVLVPSGLDGGSELLAIEAGNIVVNADRQTSLPDVWAGGDAVAGDDLTVVAVEDGKIAAHAINRHLAA